MRKYLFTNICLHVHDLYTSFVHTQFQTRHNNTLTISNIFVTILSIQVFRTTFSTTSWCSGIMSGFPLYTIRRPPTLVASYDMVATVTALVSTSLDRFLGVTWSKLSLTYDPYRQLFCTPSNETGSWLGPLFSKPGTNLSCLFFQRTSDDPVL